MSIIEETTMSEEQATAFNKPSRNIKGKLEIFFDGISKPPVIIDDANYLVDYSILEELTGGDFAYGGPTANELLITLDNSTRIFTSSNTESPYYKKIKRNVVIKAYLQEQIYGKIDIPMGTYFVQEWDTELSEIYASITAYDLMYSILNSEMPTLRIMESITAKELLDLALAEVYQGEIIYELMDNSLLHEMMLYNPILNYATVGHFFNELCKATGCMITSNRQGQIVVFGDVNSARVVPVGENQLIEFKLKEQFATRYTDYSIKYGTNLNEHGEIYSLNISAGETVQEVTLASDKFPINFTGIKCEGEANWIVTEWKRTSSSVTFKLKDLKDSTEGSTTVVIYGDYYKTNQNQVNKVSRDLYEYETRETLDIVSPFIAVPYYAEKLSDRLQKVYYDGYASGTLQVRGNPNLAIGTKLSTDSGHVGLYQRIRWNYDGGLDAVITLVGVI